MLYLALADCFIYQTLPSKVSEDEP